MLSFTHSLFVAAAATILCPQAFAASADPIAVATVKQQFINAKIVPDAIPSFNPVGLLQLNYSASVGLTTVGEAISKENVTAQPVVTGVGQFNGTSTKYTVLIVDANYVGSTNPNGLNLHWLQNNAALAADGTLSGTTTATIAYAGPGPAAGSGPHRYTVLLYAQPSNFTAPSTPKAGSGVALFNLAQYVAAAGFGAPLAGTYFTVEVGTATVTVESTTPVNPSTISIGSTPSATGSMTKTGSQSGSATGSGATTTSTSKPNGAGKSTATVGSVVLAALGAAVFLA